MIEWAEVEFRKGRSTSDGSTEDDHFESAARQFAALGNTKAAALANPQGPSFPEPLGYLARVGKLVEPLVVEADRERAHGLRRLLCHRGDDR